MMFRFTLSHEVLGSQVISEPDGWKGAKIKLERDPDFFSLIEYYEGAANGAFIFYGKNEAEGVDGGIEFIRQVETTYGFDAQLDILVEYSYDGTTYETLFSGMLDLSEKNGMPDNKMQVPIIRDGFWVKFLNRYETVVNLSDTVDLDGNAVDPVESITLQLPSQVIRKEFDGYLLDSRNFTQDEITTSDYIQLDVDTYNLDEIEQKYTLPIIDNPEIPSSVIDIEEDGEYTFDLRVEASVIHYSEVDCDLEQTVIGSASYMDVYIQKNNETPIAFTETSSSLILENISTIYTYAGSMSLVKGDQIRIYGDIVGDISALGDYANLWLHSKNGVGTVTIPNIVPIVEGGCVVDGTTTASINGLPAPSGVEIPTYFNVVGLTTYIDTQGEAYLIHDLIDGVLKRIGLPGGLYSEFLGATFTSSRQYDEDGCGWQYAIIKGLQIRGYSLTEKPFFISMKEIWEGINPILNLGLGYETLEESPETQVIRIETKRHFIGSTKQVNFSGVRQIEDSYDRDYIFKTIKTGFKEWRSEQTGGLNDPQTEHTYATIIKGSGKDKDLRSGFIAASTAIEQARRATIEKSADYKHDDKTFIISLNLEDISPDYTPELDENFPTVTGILSPETQYNLNLTPMRNLLRWRDYLAGCLQSHLTSSFKFVSGEGNYHMASIADWETCSQGIIDSLLSESQDISLEEDGTIWYLFVPQLCNITIPMEKDEFDLIDRKQPIGISQTDSGHAEFHIKVLEYDIVKGEAMIQAWPKVFFNIATPEQEINQHTCE